MIYRKIDGYDDFRCIAGACPESCCEGWQIVIDDDSLDKYSNENSPFKSRLKQSIDWEEGVFKQYLGRCAFLNNDNLCDLQCALGEEALCQTCKQYPRHIEEFYGVREYSLSLSCPEAARKMLTSTTPMTIEVVETDEDEPDEDYDDFDFLLYDQLEVVREKLFSLATDRSANIDERLSLILKYGKKLQYCLDENEIFNMENVFSEVIEASEYTVRQAREDIKILYSLEFLHSDWKNTLDTASAYLNSLADDKKIICPKGYEIPSEQILMFFIYTYFLGSVYDDCVYSKLALSVYSVIWINIIFMSGSCHTLDEYIRVAYRYAREVEHSDINLNTLDEIWMS